MVTKKPTTKKSTAKSAAAKRTVAKKAPAKRATVVRAKKAPKSKLDIKSAGNYKSFKPSNNSNQFFKVRITDQTIYWAILGFIVLALGVWVITINDKVQYMYDQVDEQNNDALVAPTHKSE